MGIILNIFGSKEVRRTLVDLLGNFWKIRSFSKVILSGFSTNSRTIY